MTKTLTKLLRGVLVLLLFLFLLTELSYLHRGYDRMMRFYGLKRNSVDAAVIGTSTTFTAYMPMEAYGERGIASCVAATNMQFENTLKYTVREVRKRQNPRLMVIDVMPFLRAHYAGTDAWNPGDRDLNIRYNVDSLPHGAARFRLISEICRGFGLGPDRVFYYCFDPIRYHLNRPDLVRFHNAVKDPARGFQHLQKEGGVEFRKADMPEDRGQELPLPEAEEKNLRDLLAVLAEDAGIAGQSGPAGHTGAAGQSGSAGDAGCRVVFCCPPVFLDTEEQIGQKNYLRRILPEAGYEFWDLTEEREAAGLLAEEDYRDPVHFDSLGSLKTTALLTERIAAAAELPDRRGDPAWGDWNEALAQWKDLRGGYLAVDTAAVGHN